MQQKITAIVLFNDETRFTNNVKNYKKQSVSYTSFKYKEIKKQNGENSLLKRCLLLFTSRLGACLQTSDQHFKHFLHYLNLLLTYLFICWC